MLRKTILIIFMFSLGFTSLQAGEVTTEQVLKPGDVKRFIKTFPLLKRDLEKLGLKYESRSGNVTLPQAIEARDKFYQIVKKHGWDENFFKQMSAIIMAYSTVVYGNQMKKASSQIEKSLKDIDANPNLSAEMKEQLKAQVKMYTSHGDVMFKNIHPKDIELVKPHLKEIKRVVENK